VSLHFLIVTVITIPTYNHNRL